MGGSINYLIVDSSSDAKEMVNYLKENKLGRATFFPLDVIKPRFVDSEVLNNIRNEDGFVATADKLVSNDEVYNNIILNQLGNIIVTNDIESANRIGKIVKHRYKVVTLDGQVVNVGGSITGGSGVNSSNVIKERYELDNYKKEYSDMLENKGKYENILVGYEKEIKECEDLVYDIRMNGSVIDENIRKQKELLGVKVGVKNDLERELKDLDSIVNNSSDVESEMLLNTYYAAVNNKDNLLNDIELLKKKKEQLDEGIKEIEELNKKSLGYINNKEKEVKEIELMLNTINMKMDNYLLVLSEDYNMTFETALNRYKLEMDSEAARDKVGELKAGIKAIGFVNVGAIEEYKRVNERYGFLTSQRNDLLNAEGTLLEIIKEMDTIMKDKFLTTFEEVRKEFKKVFVSMFRGGEAELILTDPDNILETGIEIQAVPTGKNLKSLSLLSGGEKTFTAISLLFAILNVRPVPFCVLDEVEAALDDANVESFGNYLYKYKNKTQFILITHKKKTMEFADILYGITMQESGVSKLVSVRLEDIKV